MPDLADLSDLAILYTYGKHEWCFRMVASQLKILKIKVDESTHLIFCCLPQFQVIILRERLRYYKIFKDFVRIWGIFKINPHS